LYFGFEKLAELEFRLAGEAILTAYWMEDASISMLISKYLD